MKYCFTKNPVLYISYMFYFIIYINTEYVGFSVVLSDHIEVLHLTFSHMHVIYAFWLCLIKSVLLDLNIFKEYNLLQ